MSTKSKAAIIVIMLAVVIGLSCTTPLVQHANAAGKARTVMPLPTTRPAQPAAPAFAAAPMVTDPPEYRMSWIYGFGSEFANPDATTIMINRLADNNFNVVMPEIRKAGDAYYNSKYEPWASDVAGGYDPLTDIITKAHARNMEVWGWIVTWRIWARNKTAPSTHIWAKHPEWALLNSSGGNADGSYYDLDPGVPAAQQYVCDVMKDCLTKYPELDGYNFDYIRYPGTTWGYNPFAKERFKQEYGYYPPTSGFSDITIDDTTVNTSGAAVFGGDWIQESLPDQYGTTCMTVATDASDTSTACWRPNIATTGKFDVYVWCPQASNLSAKALYTVYYNGGSVTTEVNQQTDGGHWVKIANAVEFAAGSSGYVILGNGTGEVGKYVAADAVRFENVWGKWKREQITNFVKKCYVEAKYINPRIKMTVDTIGWMAGDPRADFTSTRAYYEVCQDHADWMKDHIIDVNCLMNYKRDWTGLLASTGYRYKGYAFGNQQADHRIWSDYLAQYQASTGRHVIDGIGGYMNVMQGDLDQWGYSRSHGVGLGMYRYGFTVGQEDTANPGLPVFNRNTNVVAGPTSALEDMFYSTIKSGMFQNPAPIPTADWIENPTTGWLFGQVTDAMEPNDVIYQNWVYKATVTIVGPSTDPHTYTVQTDGTGTYVAANADGLIDMPPGTYTVTVSAPGYADSSFTQVAVTAGRATKLDVALGPMLPDDSYKNLSDALDRDKTPDGSLIGINGKVVTATLSDCIYIEEPDRSKGLQIRFGSSSPTLTEGTRVNLIGKMTTIGGERVLGHASVMSQLAGTALNPLGSNVRDLSRTPTATALLVKCTGKVVDIGSGWFNLNDGSGTIKVKCPGLVVPVKGTMVSATGVNAVDTVERCIRVRRQSDITSIAKTTITAPAGTIGMGLNLIGLPCIPTDQSPTTAFGVQPISNLLFRWDNLTQQFVGYDPATPVTFGNLTPGDGLALLSTTSGNLSFEGVAVPTSDVRISCPKAGWSLISHPLSNPVLWYDIQVSDGTQTLSLEDAVTAGWIGRIAFNWDSASGSYGYLGTGARGSRFDDSLRPWKAYWITTYKDNLAVIIPSGA